MADRMMAAMQGANVIGADTRCMSEGTSSLSAFIRVAQPLDNYNDLYLDINIAGTASGIEPIDELQIKYAEDIDHKDCMHLLIKKGGGISKMKVNNQVASNPIGYYEAGKNFANLPCRLTHFTRTNFEKYNNGLPFIQHIDKLFKRLIPDAHERQLQRASLKSHLNLNHYY